MRAKSGLASWYARLAAFQVEDLFSRKKDPGPRRTIFVNENLPEDFRDQNGKVKREHIYATNQVLTSKYTILTFIPRNLLEQFRRVANVFFLCIAILQFFPKFSTISPGLVLLPLLIVLTITALKDSYEDVKRHQSDRRVNHTVARTLQGGSWVNLNVTASKHKTFVRGLPRLHGRKETTIKPSFGAVSDPEKSVVTIDGEYDDTSEEGPSRRRSFSKRGKGSRPYWMNTIWEDVRVGDFIKIKNNELVPADILICSTSEEENVAFVETKNLDGETNLKSRHAVPALRHLRSAADCANGAHHFRLECDRPNVNMFKLDATLIGEKEEGEGEAGNELEKHPIDMSMMVLRGMVVRNTKWIIGIVLYTGSDTRIVMNSGGTRSKQSKVERQMNPQVFINLVILAFMAIACAIADSVLEEEYYRKGALWLYGDDQPDDNPSINGLVTWAFALITFQNIVPISLYISIEFVRTCQAAFIYFDTEIYYDKTEQPTLARSWNLSDDLGQIEYIFSDKTGTLTQNSMAFRQCSIGGKLYAGDPGSDHMADDGIRLLMPIKEFTPPPTGNSSSATSSGTSRDNEEAPHPRNSLSGNAIKLSPRVLHHFHDTILHADIAGAIHADPDSDNAALARSINGFFVVLALCHTVLASIDPQTNAIEYMAQSPDEAALVQAAADMGFVFRGREAEVLILQTPFSDEMERYELLNILDFTSARKRMSVVVRKLDDEDRRVFLLTKGADSVIFERLRPGADDLKNTTERHLAQFASSGLRTLTLAYKVVSDEEYAAWNDRYHEATVSLDEREKKTEEVSDELERDLRILGATAIEDKLQDGVPETIADLRRAGIKVWVATGDKLETAIAIGQSANLISHDANIIVIRWNGDGCPVYQQLVNAAEEFFPECNFPTQPEQPRRSRSRSSNSVDHDRNFPVSRVDFSLTDIVGSNNGDRPGGFILVIDGSALEHALSDDQSSDLLLRLSTMCEGVLCCRVSPLQKALVVKLVKEGLGAITLAVGDGANDVSMIQSADIGVGIAGEEGLQAVNASDYAIAQFRFLKRLLLVHGHWSYARNGNMILNFFYKNIVCVGVLWWFQIYCAWSSNYVFEYTYLLFWNSFWTLVPVIAIGLFDRIVDADILMNMPELYRYGREGKWFGLRSFTIYMFDGVMQSAAIFFFIWYTYTTASSRNDGWAVGLYELSTTMVFSAVIIANLFNGLNTHAWTIWVFFAVSIGIVLLMIYTAIYNVISPGWFHTNIYGNNYFLLHSPYFWLCLPLTICVALAPRYLTLAWKFYFSPDDLDILRYLRKKSPDKVLSRDVLLFPATNIAHRRASLISRSTRCTGSTTSLGCGLSLDHRSASRTDMSTGLRTVHRGFNFSTEESGVAMHRMQTNLSERQRSNRNLASMADPGVVQRKCYQGSGFTVRRGFLRKKASQAQQTD